MIVYQLHAFPQSADKPINSTLTKSQSLLNGTVELLAVRGP